MLRSQSQAMYSPDNIGHFGLALKKYAHFTSPIRRYADLLVHRALIAGLKLGEGGLPPEDGERFEQIGEDISGTERRAAMAERDAVDRYVAAYMADKVGAEFPGRVSGSRILACSYRFRKPVPMVSSRFPPCPMIIMCMMPSDMHWSGKIAARHSVWAMMLLSALPRRMQQPDRLRCVWRDMPISPTGT